MSTERIEPGARMSRAVVHGDTIYTAGHVPSTASASASVTEQTKDVLAQLEALLARCGSDKSRILSTTIYLTDMSTFNEMNAVWDAWVDKANPPARATVEATLANPAFKVEIAMIAAR